jgi:hypothetical protein
MMVGKAREGESCGEVEVTKRRACVLDFARE